MYIENKTLKWQFIVKTGLESTLFFNGSSLVWGADVGGWGEGRGVKQEEGHIHYYSGYWFGSADVLIGVCRRHEDVMRTSSNPEMETFSPRPGDVLRTF